MQDREEARINMEERILRQGRANLIVGKWFVDSGLGVLTNKRFVYFRARLSKILAMSAGRIGEPGPGRIRI